MAIIDFFKRQPVPTSAPSAPPVVTDTPTKVSAEDLIEDERWMFSFIRTEHSRQFSSSTIQDAAAIYSAQQMRRIADDIEAIRKHLTRLQLVEPPRDPPDGDVA